MIFANGKIFDFEGSKEELLSNISIVISNVHKQNVLTENEIREAVDIGLMSEDEFNKLFKESISKFLKNLAEMSCDDCDECEEKDKCDAINKKAESAKETEDLLKKIFGDIL